MRAQLNLFGSAESLPEGFRYRADVLTAHQEAALIERFEGLPFKEFEFHGFLGKRRIVSYGWKYDYSAQQALRSEDIPDFLLPVREAAARFAGMEPSAFQQVLLTEYRPGASIGWHRDKAVFGEVIGLSLASPCLFRFRRKRTSASGTNWQRANVTIEPRSAYLLQGPARTVWEHSIPAVDSLRYSITFRTFKGPTER
jgi:alkylated DNA repair dioxygenase AlkB